MKVSAGIVRVLLFLSCYSFSLYSKNCKPDLSRLAASHEPDLQVQQEALCHEKWKEDWKAKNGDKPRWKTTDKPGNPLGSGGENPIGLTEEQIQEHAERGNLVDITKVTDPRDLPQKIRQSTQDSVAIAASTIEAAKSERVNLGSIVRDWEKVEKGSLALPEFLKRYPRVATGGHEIHEKWVENNSWLPVDDPLRKPFGELVPEEQKKDIEFVIGAARLADKKREKQFKDQMTEFESATGEDKIAAAHLVVEQAFYDGTDIPGPVRSLLQQEYEKRSWPAELSPRDLAELKTIARVHPNLAKKIIERSGNVSREQLASADSASSAIEATTRLVAELEGNKDWFEGSRVIEAAREKLATQKELAGMFEESRSTIQRNEGQTVKSAPPLLPAFPKAERVEDARAINGESLIHQGEADPLTGALATDKKRTERTFDSKRVTWRDGNTFYQWDSRHGKLEVWRNK